MWWLVRSEPEHTKTDHNSMVLKGKLVELPTLTLTDIVKHMDLTADTSPVLLGEAIPSLTRFSDLDETFLRFHSDDFQALGIRQKFRAVNEGLISRIQNHEVPCFLLASVLEYLDRVNREKILEEPLSLKLFEFYLNHFSGLSSEEIQKVRGKIVGRFLPRDEYQVFFPVGMGKMFSGSHFVAAHLSPDVDTTVSSFWGWADAFGCRVAEGIHQWSLPKGLSDGHIQLFFKRLFGERVFEQVSRRLSTITLTALDLVTSKGFHKVCHSSRADTVDDARDNQAIIVVDEEGLYRGEWGSHDAEAVRHVITAFSNCLRWFESQCHSRTIRALADDGSTEKEVAHSYDDALDTVIGECASAKETHDKTKQYVHDYVEQILGLKGGMECTFRELFVQLDTKFKSSFSNFFEKCVALQTADLFDESGVLKADRVQAMRRLEQIVQALEKALDIVRDKIERLEHLLEVKENVLERPSIFITLKSDVDEMRSKINHYDHLTVVVSEGEGRWFPVGIVQEDDLRETIVGTASFRDFSNPEETKMASYVEVISIIDHHKTRIQTSGAPTLLMGDAQSTNTLVAEQSLRINRRYGQELLTGVEGIDIPGMSDQIKRAFGLTAFAEEGGFFVDAQRELTEYFFYLYGILDDTDLLTKVSRRDVLVVKKLLDRMRSLLDRKPSEAVSFVDLPNDESFVKGAAKRLLQNKDLHSIYAKVYQFREKETDSALLAAIKKEPSTVFLDTKEQNGCCRVGQTKLFKSNISTFCEHRQELMRLWYEGAHEINSARAHVDFFAHMISTVAGEKEVFCGQESEWDHQDEMWLWIPETGVAEQHLVGFLNNFQRSSSALHLDIDVEISGINAASRKQLFKQNFSKARKIQVVEGYEETVVVLKYRAGALNSRKSQVSPYLPKLVP